MTNEELANELERLNELRWFGPQTNIRAAIVARDNIRELTTANLPAIISALRENSRMREALRVPDVWSQTERDGMAAAFSSADGKHGHYETLFAVAAWLLRHRAASLRQLDTPSMPNTP